MKSKKVNEFNKILVAQTAFLGDMVLTTPLFAGLRSLFPDAKIALLTTPAAAPLVEEDRNIDEILTYDKNGGESLVSVLKKVRSRDFDLFMAPHRSYRTSLIGFFSEIPVRIGYRESGFSWLHTRKVARPMELHEVDRILALLKAIPADPRDLARNPDVGYTDAEAREVADVLTEAGVGENEKLVGLCPGSVWATKRWTGEGYASLGRALQGLGYRLVLIGGPQDRSAADEVLGGLCAGCVDAVGKTSLKALAAWADRFALFVTNDSAPLHVAAARGTPTVALFGPTVRELGFFPLHENSKVVEVELECRPCGSHGHNECPLGHFSCMRLITPEMVLSSCLELLRK